MYLYRLFRLGRPIEGWIEPFAMADLQDERNASRKVPSFLGVVNR